MTCFCDIAQLPRLQQVVDLFLQHWIWVDVQDVHFRNWFPKKVCLRRNNCALSWVASPKHSSDNKFWIPKLFHHCFLIFATYSASVQQIWRYSNLTFKNLSIFKNKIFCCIFCSMTYAKTFPLWWKNVVLFRFWAIDLTFSR